MIGKTNKGTEFKYDEKYHWLIESHSINSDRCGYVMLCLKKNRHELFNNYKTRINLHRAICILEYNGIENGLQVDHLNGDRLDNRVNNLRLISKKENLRNIVYNDIYPYITYNKTCNYFQVYITDPDYKGRFDSIESALNIVEYYLKTFKLLDHNTRNNYNLKEQREKVSKIKLKPFDDCKQCGIIIWSKKAFEIHVCQPLIENPLLNCRFCRKAYKTNSKFKGHICNIKRYLNSPIVMV